MAPNDAILQCLADVARGDGTYRFFLLRHTSLDESVVNHGDVDLLGTHESVHALISFVGTLAKQGRCSFRVRRSSPDKTRMTLYSTDLRRHVEMDLWETLWQIDGGRHSLKFEDLERLAVGSDALQRLPVALETAIYLEHLSAKKKDLGDPTVIARLEHYRTACAFVNQQLSEACATLLLRRQLNATYRSDLTSKVISDFIGARYRRQRLGRSMRRKLHTLKQKLVRSRARAVALVGCDGAGKTSVAQEVAALSDAVELLPGKQLYRRTLLFRALYKINRLSVKTTRERIDETFAPLAYALSWFALRRQLRATGSAGATLLLDRFLPDFLYLRRKTDRPRFSRLLQLMPPLRSRIPVVHFVAPSDVLSRRKGEMTPEGQARYDRAMLRYYTSGPADYLMYCNAGTLHDASAAIFPYIRGLFPSSARTSSPVPKGRSSMPSSSIEAVPDSATPLRRWSRRAVHMVHAALVRGIGWRGLLWFVVAYLFIMAVAPRPSLAPVLFLILTGMFVQCVLYRVSHFPALVVGRSILFVTTLAALGTLLGVALVSGVTWETYLSVTSSTVAVDRTTLGMAMALALGVIASSLKTRASLVRGGLHYTRRMDTARTAARVLGSWGRFHLGFLLDTLEDLVQLDGRTKTSSNPKPGAEDSGELELSRRVAGLVQDCRVRDDSRYARPIPWVSCARIVQAYVDARRHDARTQGITLSFTRGEELDDVRVRASTICGLLDAVIASIQERPATIRTTSVSRDGLLVIQAAVSPAPPAGIAVSTAAASEVRAARDMNLALDDGVVLDRQRLDDGSVCFELSCALRRDSETGWRTFNPNPDELRVLSESPNSKGAKRLFRNDGVVFRVRRIDVVDPKPTLIEEEYLIMRRLSEVSPAFPRAVGFGATGAYEWLSYRYEPGPLLIDWLKEPEHRSQWFRVVADVQNMIRHMRENAVAHRDVHPGNIIVKEDGSLVLIDFDQSVADDKRFLQADTRGAREGLAWNDIEGFIERCGLTRTVNRALGKLEEAWRLYPPDAANQPSSAYELEFAGQRLPGSTPR